MIAFHDPELSNHLNEIGFIPDVSALCFDECFKAAPSILPVQVGESFSRHEAPSKHKNKAKRGLSFHLIAEKKGKSFICDAGCYVSPVIHELLHRG